MNKMFALFIGALSCVPSISFASGEFNLLVHIQAQSPPASVTVENEEDAQPSTLEKKGDVYETKIPVPQLSDQVVLHYRLVALWDNQSAQPTEELYLAFRPVMPESLRLSLYREQPESYDWKGLDRIDALGTDQVSTLRRYYLARVFHRNWRHQKQLPFHDNALRSAKLWFDASADLAKRRNSFIRFDEEIAKIVKDYEDRAKGNVSFRTRLRKHFRAGFITDTLNDVTAARYAFVGEISSLVTEGKLSEAVNLNALALSSLTKEPSNVERLVIRRQNINLDLLRSNESYLATLTATATQPNDSGDNMFVVHTD